MTTFTIDTENNITAFPAPEHAKAAVGAGAQAFTSQKELAKLAAAWPSERIVAVWNSLPGVEPVKGFKSAKTASSRIWAHVQGLGEPEKPKAEGGYRGNAQPAEKLARVPAAAPQSSLSALHRTTRARKRSLNNPSRFFPLTRATSRRRRWSSLTATMPAAIAHALQRPPARTTLRPWRQVHCCGYNIVAARCTR